MRGFKQKNPYLLLCAAYAPLAALRSPAGSGLPRTGSYRCIDYMAVKAGHNSQLIWRYLFLEHLNVLVFSVNLALHEYFIASFNVIL